MSASVLFSALDKLTSTAPNDGAAQANLAQKLSANLTLVKQFLKENDRESDGLGSDDNDNSSLSSSTSQFVDDFLDTSLGICARLRSQGSESEQQQLWSVKQEAILKRTLQMIVVMGILPNLHANVGLPLHRRTASGVKFAELEGQVVCS